MSNKSVLNFTRKEIYTAVYAAVIVFLTYATVYGFRKTYTAGTYEGQSVFGLGYKEVLVIIQALGYMSSKFFGIKFISELKRWGRWKVVLLLVSISWMAWLLFALVPSPFNVVFLFLNGFPLGLLWGVIFSYIEGRKATDVIGAAMAVSFIFSSGIVKSIGSYLVVHSGISETWMPFVAGAVFFPFLVFFLYMMEKIPPPTEADKIVRVDRIPMTGDQRKALLKEFAPGLILLITIYVFLTVFRDLRDNFIADIWLELGFGNQPALFTQTETPVTIAVLILVGALILIKKNLKALMIIHWIIGFGFIIAGLSTYLFVTGVLSPVLWVTFVGLGLYMGYIPFNCVLFERFIATFRISGNVGFLMYLADSFGYLGSVGVILSKTILNTQGVDLQWTDFYSKSVMILSVFGLAGTIFSAVYFNKKKIIIQDSIPLS